MLSAQQHFDDVEPGGVGQDLKRRYMHYYVYVSQYIFIVKTSISEILAARPQAMALMAHTFPRAVRPQCESSRLRLGCDQFISVSNCDQMLSTGDRLGSFEILNALGAGGMGEVYRARDAKLGRDVALKVLPEAFARDDERMARFQREAKVLASLNHHNIATVHGLEDSGSMHALVMELVAGPTLAERIGSGPIPVGEALPIARQICDALEYVLLEPSQIAGRRRLTLHRPDRQFRGK